jgi:hypothetical protein
LLSASIDSTVDPSINDSVNTSINDSKGGVMRDSTKSERIFAAIGAASDDLLLYCEESSEESAVRNENRQVKPWLKYSGIAACLCLLLVSSYLAFQSAFPGLPTPFKDPTGSGQPTPGRSQPSQSAPRRSQPASPSDASGKPVLEWSDGFTAADYFKYNDSADNGGSVAQSSADAALPYAETRSFSGDRIQLEDDGVIPVVDTHPLFDCYGNYNKDGSLYSLVIAWHRRGTSGSGGNGNGGNSLDDYSDLSITAGYQEGEKITCCIAIELDENGNIMAPAVTVTERDGIKIIAEGRENSNKTLTFQNGSGWYQIEGSWNDSYEDMAALLDWIWEHPIPFERFAMETGDNFTQISLEQMPDAFDGYIPDFAAFGFIEGTSALTLKNGVPYAYEGQYIAHAPEESVKASDYYHIPGWTIIHWCIYSDGTSIYVNESMGELDELTEQSVFDRFDSSGNQSNITFTWNGLWITVYSNTPQELWTILETLITR